jgi:hypothetical protein
MVKVDQKIEMICCGLWGGYGVNVSLEKSKPKPYSCCLKKMKHQD